MTAAVFLLALGASGRITRFITSDALAEDFRGWVVRRYGSDSRRAYLVGCPWCVSPYVCGAVFALGWAYGLRDWFVWPAMALSASYLIGLVASNLDDE